MRKVLPKMWSAEEGLTALLVCIAVLCFVVLPLAGLGLLGDLAFLAMDGLLAAMLLSGVKAFLRAGLPRLLGMMGVFVLIAIRGIVRMGEGRGPDAIEAGIAAIALGALTAMVLIRVLRKGPVTRQRIEGAVAVYLLFGTVWAELYQFLSALTPGAISAVHGTAGAKQTAELFYFSFVTLTTTGYGDILPVSVAARTLANLEGLIGQLYPAILIARLVSLQITSKGPEK